ncbi:MAG: hypothetical protein HQM09_01690 [Candidatus Riflebacteria bacterium]|nr:hypothetical protein [Candidatus Riflebacteria bacterium]
MSFLKRIIEFFKSDPTRNWPAMPRKSLKFSLADKTLNGMTFGHSFEALEIFGKPDNEMPIYDKTFHYLRHGLIVELDDQKIDFFAFIIQDDAKEGFAEAQTTLVDADGKTIILSKNSAKNDLVAFLGDPQKIDEDEVEIILFFDINDLKIEFELDLSQKLKRMNVFPASKIH